MTPRERDYLISGSDASGRECRRRVSATSAAAALAQVEAEGIRDAKLHVDDFVPNLTSAPARQLIRENSVRDHFSIVTGSRLKFWLIVIAREYRNGVASVLLAAAYFTLRMVAPSPLSWRDLLAAAVILFPLAAVVYGTRGSRLLHRIQRESVNARYERVLKLAPLVEHATKKSLGEAAGAVAGAEWRAKALTRLGRRDEALEEIARLGVRPDVPAEVVHLYRGIVHAVDKDWHSAIDCYEEAVRIKPDLALAWAGIASIQAIYLQDVVAARRAWEVVREFPASEYTDAMRKLAEAAILLLEDSPGNAERTLIDALPRLVKTARRSPAGGASVTLARTLLTIACAKNGKQDEARTYFRLAEPSLQLHQYTELITRCRHALDDADRTGAVNRVSAG